MITYSNGSKFYLLSGVLPTDVMTATATKKTTIYENFQVIISYEIGLMSLPRGIERILERIYSIPYFVTSVIIPVTEKEQYENKSNNNSFCYLKNDLQSQH